MSLHSTLSYITAITGGKNLVFHVSLLAARKFKFKFRSVRERTKVMEDKAGFYSALLSILCSHDG